MPKGRKTIKTANTAKKVNNQRRMRIGTRKAGVAAHGLSNDKLQEVLADENKTRYHTKARTVLLSRGVSL